MALATRCPACHTTFRVVSDQLKLRRGLVKCGACGEIFNGIEHMRYIHQGGEETRAHSASVAAVEDSPHEDDRELALALPTITRDPGAPTPISYAADDDDQVATDTGTPYPSPSVTQASSNEVESDSAVSALSAHESTLPAPAKRRWFSRTARPAPATPIASDPLNPMTLLDTTDAASSAVVLDDYELPSFLQPQKRSSWLVRLGWSVGMLCATAALLAQTVYWYRHELAALADPYTPQVRAWLNQGCALLPANTRCTIDLPRHLYPLRVAAAEIVETADPGYYWLRLTLRNDGPLPQAFPALDITLSDARNAIVTRRVVTVAEYAVHALPEPIRAQFPQGLAGYTEQSFILPVRMNPDTPTTPPIKVAGYLVDIFYP